MEFVLTTSIESPPAEVFCFLRDVYLLPFDTHPVVPIYEKLTAGPVAVGTRSREVVRTSPFTGLEIFSEVIDLQPDTCLAYRWQGSGMHGELVYELSAESGSTRLVQRQTLLLAGALQLFGPFVRRAFAARLAARLAGIKALLEGRTQSGEVE